mmetsp:Transcript_385/g.657  ORF Transcript_385/g.657 Transcript_385/m.657 type:complete len:113 (-) Transcript_385:8-346(-)
MLFCPYCATKLVLRYADVMTYSCINCAYRYLVNEGGKHNVQYINEQPAKFVEKSEAVSKESADEQITSIDGCPNPKCDSRAASFIQMQIRSGDEPMTIVYRCVKCSESWRSD